MRLRYLAATAAVLASSTLLHAETIAFNKLPGSNGTAFTSFDNGNYTVTQGVGQFFVATLFGNPAPDIYGGTSAGGSNPSSVVVTRDSGGAFTFSSVDLANAITAGTYSFSGYSGAQLLYSQTGVLANNSFLFNTFTSNYSSEAITSLNIQLTGGDYNIDNIKVNGANVNTAATPEPSSLALLGTGVLGVIGAAKRRFQA